MPLLTSMFSASVSLRIHAVMITISGRMPASAVRVASASSRSAGTGMTPSGRRSVRRASPCTSHPWRMSSADTVCPAIPVAPTTSARRFCALFITISFERPVQLK